MALTVIGPVLVEGEDGFGERWKGDGTEENPYKLKEDYEIDADGNNYGIKIASSDKYVEIKDSKIHGASGEEGAGIILDYSSNVKIINNEIYNNDIGLYCVNQTSSQNSVVKGNQITGNRYGLYYDEGRGDIVKDNEISDNTEAGIYLTDFSVENEFIGNTISNNGGHGIETEEYVVDNLIEDNSITGNDGSGIYFFNNTIENKVTENLIENNAVGIEIEESYDNEIWRNQFIDNTVQASDNDENYWDLGDPAEGGDGGNRWSDYDGEDRGDGVGDTPYDIDDGENQDGFPWVIEDVGIFWAEEIVTGVSIDEVDVGEIRGEIEGIADHVGLEITWEEFGEDGLPVEDDIKSDQAKELRDKTEKIYINRHSSVNTGNETEVDKGHDAEVEGDHDSSFESDHDGPYCTGHDSEVETEAETDYDEIDKGTFNSGEDAGHYGEYDSQVEDENHTDYNSDHDSQVEDGYESGYESVNYENDEGSHDSVHENEHNGDYESGHDSDDDGTDYGTYHNEVWSNDDGSYDGTYQSGHDSGYDSGDDGSNETDYNSGYDSGDDGTVT